MSGCSKHVNVRLDHGLCVKCQEKHIAELEAENARLRGAIRQYDADPDSCYEDMPCVSEAARQDLVERLDIAREALQQVNNIYPDLKFVEDALERLEGE